MSGRWIQIGNVFIKMWREPMAAIRMHLTASKYKKRNWPRAQLLVLKFSAMFEPKPCFSWAVPSHQLSSQDTKAGLFRETWLFWEVTFSRTPDSLASSSLLAAWGSGRRPTQPSFPLPFIQGQACSAVWWLPRLFPVPSSSFSILLPNKILTLTLVSVSASQRSWAHTKYEHEEKLG